MIDKLNNDVVLILFLMCSNWVLLSVPKYNCVFGYLMAFPFETTDMHVSTVGNNMYCVERNSQESNMLKQHISS